MLPGPVDWPTMSRRRCRGTSESVETYLKEIFLLSRHGGRARTGDLADRLQVTPPSVTEMAGKLHRDGLVQYEKRKGARLTPAGKRRARELLRKHCLIERFLVEVLDVGPAFHDEACRMEHAVSDDVARKLADLVERDDECPGCYDPRRRHCARLRRSEG